MLFSKWTTVWFRPGKAFSKMLWSKITVFFALGWKRYFGWIVYGQTDRFWFSGHDGRGQIILNVLWYDGILFPRSVTWQQVSELNCRLFLNKLHFRQSITETRCSQIARRASLLIHRNQQFAICISSDIADRSWRSGPWVLPFTLWSLGKIHFTMSRKRFDLSYTHHSPFHKVGLSPLETHTVLQKSDLSYRDERDVLTTVFRGVKLKTLCSHVTEVKLWSDNRVLRESIKPQSQRWKSHVLTTVFGGVKLETLFSLVTEVKL